MGWPLSSPYSPHPSEGTAATIGWAVTAAGTLALDDLTTPAGRRREVPGGSALYFALAARNLCTVRVAGAIGPDGRSLLEMLDRAGVDRSAVVELPGPTYRWRAEHHPLDAVPVEEEQRLGVYLDWRPRLPDLARTSEILFLGSMHPDRQFEVLEQCSTAQVVALDTMRDFIVSHRATLEQLLQRSDLLLANEAELRALMSKAPADSIQAAREALKRWELQTVILKLGARGAVAVSATSQVHSPPFPGPAVVDPTGAGDALAGGLLGRLAQFRQHDDAAVNRAMADGSAAARRAISAFGVDGLIESGA